MYVTYSTQYAAAGIAVPAGILSSNNLVLQMKIKKPAAYILPDKRPWKERHRVDIRKREGRQREDFRKRDRDRKGYKRPDAGKRPKTHRGASGSSRKHTVVPFKRRLRSKTKADECKEHDRAKECGLVRINPETALLPIDAPRPQLRLVWQDQEQFKEEEGTGGYKRPDYRSTLHPSGRCWGTC